MSNHAGELRAVANLHVAKRTMAGLRVLGIPGISDSDWAPLAAYFWQHNKGGNVMNRCLLLNSTIQLTYRTSSGDIESIVPTIFPAVSKYSVQREDGEYVVVTSPMRWPSRSENAAIRRVIRDCIDTYQVTRTSELRNLLRVEAEGQPITISDLLRSINFSSVLEHLDIIDNAIVEPATWQIADQQQLLTPTALQEVSTSLDCHQVDGVKFSASNALDSKLHWHREMGAGCCKAAASCLQHVVRLGAYVLYAVIVIVIAVLVGVGLQGWLLWTAPQYRSFEDISHGLPKVMNNYTCSDPYCIGLSEFIFRVRSGRTQKSVQ